LSDGTTTTLEPTTTTTEFVTTTTGGGNPQNYDITFNLDTAPTAGIASLQFSVGYATANGAFEGSGVDVVCTWGTGFFAVIPNDQDKVCSGGLTTLCTDDSMCSGKGTCTVEAPADLRKLTVGVIALANFKAPKFVGKCTFNGISSDPPVAGDFTVTLEDPAPGVATVGVVVTPQ